MLSDGKTNPLNSIEQDANTSKSDKHLMWTLLAVDPVDRLTELSLKFEEVSTEEYISQPKHDANGS